MKKPIIGIVARPSNVFNTIDIEAVEETYRNAILNAGGIPILILPPQQISYQSNKPGEIEKLTDEEKEILKSQIDICDGILIPGGLKAYEYDYFISDYTKEKNIPILGICLGMQVMARSNGNAVIRKNDTDISHYSKDDYAHNVIINEDSLLNGILLSNKIMVNSFHNYHIEEVKNFDITARSKDDIIEAIEDKNHPFRLGVQWHPEKNYKDDENSRRIFKKFIDAADNYSYKKEVK